MKKNIKYFAIALILLCCLMGAASAAEDVSADVVDASTDAVTVDAVSEDVSDSVESTVVEDEPVVDDSASAQDDNVLESAVDDEILEQSSDVNDELLAENECVVYVGENKTEDGGNGTYENPYATLELAHASINGHYDKIIINIFNGTYELNKEFVFDTDELIVQGISEEVIIKYSNTNKRLAFSLLSPTAKFVMNNITFDAKGYNGISLRGAAAHYFQPFYGEGNTVIYTNCNFKDFRGTYLIGPNLFNSEYINCLFSNFFTAVFYDNNGYGEYHINVKNSILIYDYDEDYPYSFFYGDEFPTSDMITLDGIWFGENGFPYYTYGDFDDEIYNVLNKITKRYAIFTASENYIGNNQYEIIGKLTWNGTDEVADGFNPMTVTLSSSTGDIQESAVLADGTFKVIYNSTSSNNLVNVVLDWVEIPLSFNTVGITVNASDITYGDAQVVNVSISEVITGTVNLTVNGQTYEVPFDGVDSVLYTIPDALPAGTHEITAKFEDAEHNVWFSSANMTVSKVEDYPFSPVVPSDVQNGEISISLDLPEDATGTLTVTVNGKEYTKALDKGKATVTIDDLPAGTYNATVTYSGDDKYGGSTSNATFTIDPIKTSISAAKVSTTYNVAKNLVITLKDINGKALANKKVTVKVGTISKTLTTDKNGKVSLNVATLVPKTYTATVKFAGDSSYTASAVSPKVVVSKAKVKLAAKAKTFKVKVKTKKYVVTLKNNKGKVMKKVKLTLKVGKKTYKATTNSKGKATFKITKLTKKGKYTATIKFAGSKYYNKLTKKVKVTVKK